MACDAGVAGAPVRKSSSLGAAGSLGMESGGRERIESGVAA